MQSYPNRRREKSVEAYYKNPKYCIQCNIMLMIRGKESVSTRKKHNFCSFVCVGTYTRARHAGHDVPDLVPHIPTYKRENFNIKLNTSPFKTKGETKEQIIRQHARKVFRAKHGDKAPCVACGYDRYVDVCHVKPIRDFPDDTKLFEINTNTNLVGLCPTHHWEFDNGILVLGEDEMSVRGPEVGGPVHVRDCAVGPIPTPATKLLVSVEVS